MDIALRAFDQHGHAQQGPPSSEERQRGPGTPRGCGGCTRGGAGARGAGGAGAPAAASEPQSEGVQKANKLKRAIKALRCNRAGGVRRAVHFLMTKTPPPHVDAAFVDDSVRPLIPPLAGGTIDNLLAGAWVGMRGHCGQH